MIIETFIAWYETAPAEKRVPAVSALARAWAHGNLDADARETAEAAMTWLLDDPDIVVRATLATVVAARSDAPRHMILILAEDVPAVSRAILATSPLLLDGELIAMLPRVEEEGQIAIAGREVMSGPLCRALAAEACEAACIAMLVNPASRLGEADFDRLAERFGDSDEMRRCLLARSDTGMRARLVLIDAYARSLVDADRPAQIESRRRKNELREACDKAIITFAAHIEEQGIVRLVEALIAAKRLTPAFLLRAICMGNLALVAQALALLAGQPLARVERIFRDDRRNALQAVYARSGLPQAAFGVFQAAIEGWREALAGSGDEAELPYQVTRKVLATYRAKTADYAKAADHAKATDPGVDDLLVLMRRICADAARDSARARIARIALKQAERERLPAPPPERAIEVDPRPLAETAGEPTVPARLAKAPAAEDDPETTIAFAAYLANELADLALSDAAALARTENELQPANAAAARSSRFERAA